MTDQPAEVLDPHAEPPAEALLSDRIRRRLIRCLHYGIPDSLTLHPITGREFTAEHGTVISNEVTPVFSVVVNRSEFVPERWVRFDYPDKTIAYDLDSTVFVLHQHGTKENP